MFRTGITILALLAPWVVAAAEEAPAGTSAVEQGRDLYRIYCRDCHGDGGAGDGPTARKLTTRPPDLRRLARNNGGKFPVEETRSAIDGRQLHGSREMPVWGFAFQELDRDVGQEDEVRERIERLIEYLKSIQVPPLED